MMLENRLLYTFRCLYLCSLQSFGYFIFGQFYFKLHINLSHFVSPFSLHLLGPVSPHYTHWHNVTCLWVLELIQPSILLPLCPSCLKWYRAWPSQAAFTKQLTKKGRKPFETDQHTLLLCGRSFGLCCRHALCTTSEMTKTVPSCIFFADKSLQDDLCGLWTPPLLKEKKAEATGEQDGVHFSGMGSNAMFLGREHCCRLPLERPNIPKDKHSAAVNREGQGSCLLQPTDSIHGNLNTQVPSEVASENIPYLCFIFQVLISPPLFFFFWD